MQRGGDLVQVTRPHQVVGARGVLQAACPTTHGIVGDATKAPRYGLVLRAPPAPSLRRRYGSLRGGRQRWRGGASGREVGVPAAARTPRRRPRSPPAATHAAPVTAPRWCRRTRATSVSLRLRRRRQRRQPRSLDDVAARGARCSASPSCGRTAGPSTRRSCPGSRWRSRQTRAGDQRARRSWPSERPAAVPASRAAVVQLPLLLTARGHTGRTPCTAVRSATRKSTLTSTGVAAPGR